ncbi:hypothetical protein BDN72DRAFT_768736 [Pluteus cervinus]|uniref:Uncharacterized protein n=1 Tax=Pluteus cervinus TaxID=181527 RepID=A0ACD3ASB5_9AGAR|nr:hypothetical protein BDN72DRAFT_768736 [Pluteus cervinus]
MSLIPTPVDPASLGVPTDESSSDLLHDSTNLIAETTVVSVIYGIMLTLFAICFYLLFKQKSRANSKRTVFYITYITIMAFFGTLYVASAAREGDEAYVKHRLFPNGPLAYAAVIYSKPSTVLGTVSWMLINFMADGVVLWRVFVLYQSSIFRWIVCLPALMYLASVGMGLATVIQSSLPNSNLFLSTTINLALPYFALSVSMTVLATSLMIGRILYHRRRFQKLFGPQSAGEYTGIMAMLVESAALYAAFCIIFIPLYATNNPLLYIFLASLAQVQIIAPLLIILRVSRGKAWSGNTHANLTSMGAKNHSETYVEKPSQITQTASLTSTKLSIQSVPRSVV